MIRRSVHEETCLKIISFCNKKRMKDGICVHSPLLKLGLHDNSLLCNNLLSLYSKCYGGDHARHFFDEMPYRDIVSWTGVLSDYGNQGRHIEALRFYDLMRLSGENPNEFTLSSVLKSCSSIGDLDYGTKVQASVIKNGFESNPVLCSGLVELYTKWDLIEAAVKWFDGTAIGDTVSWTTMISSFVQAGKWVQALRFFVRMIEGGVFPNEYTFVKLVGACASLGIKHGKLVHAQLIVWGVQLNLVLKTALVGMYAKCQKMEDAMRVLKQTSDQDVTLWTSVITGFTQNLKFQEAISVFRQMVGNGIVPNSYTYAGILNACSSTQALQSGKQIHTQLLIAGLGNDVSVGNALLDFYTKCSIAVEDVTGVFNMIALPNVISWTTLIAGLAAHGLENESFLAFMEMRILGLQPNSHTLCYILQASATAESPKLTRKLHGFIIKTNAYKDIVVGNALVDAYAGLHMVDAALHVVKGMTNKNVITYTVLASKLNQIGCHTLTLDVIRHAREDDIQFDGFLMSTFLSAAANLSSLQTGKQLHCYSIKSGFSGWISVWNGLIDLYGKCQRISDAQKTFEEISDPDIISWNGFMHSLASNGHITSALSTLEDMILAGVRPDSVTLLIVLSACRQGDLAGMGVQYFHSLTELYDIKPQPKHYNLLVDILGHVGRLEEAIDLLRSMPFCPDASIYKKLLQSCKLHRKVLLGEEMARRGLELEPSDVEFHFLLASIYDDAGQPDLGDNIRSTIKGDGWRKTSTCSLVASC